MDYATLGEPGVRVSRIALGTWAMGDARFWGPQDEATSARTIAAALDHGINLLDTAEVYGDGRSEEVIGRALKGRRHEAVIATKAYGESLRPETRPNSLDASLRRLRTDHVDIYYIHWPNPDVPLADTFGALAELRAAGKIRAGAICNFGPRKMAELTGLIESGAPVTCVAHQLPYNLLWRAIEGDILAPTRAAGMEVVVYSPLAQGLLTGTYRNLDQVPAHLKVTRFYDGANKDALHGEQGCEAELFAAIDGLVALCEEAGVGMPHLALAWVLAQPDVGSLLVGARTPEEIEENAAVLDVALSPDVLRSATGITEPVRARLGPNPDMWMGGSRSRFV